MKNIMRNFKRWMLKIQIKRCDLTVNQLIAELEGYHELIIKKTMRGDNQARIERLQSERDGLVDTSLDLLRKKCDLLDQLIRA
jgi:hypothetical protein